MIKGGDEEGDERGDDDEEDGDDDDGAAEKAKPAQFSQALFLLLPQNLQ